MRDVLIGAAKAVLVCALALFLSLPMMAFAWTFGSGMDSANDFIARLCLDFLYGMAVGYSLPWKKLRVLLPR